VNIVEREVVAKDLATGRISANVCVSEGVSTLTTDRFLVCVVQVVDMFDRDKLWELWTSVPRDPTKYFDKV